MKRDIYQCGDWLLLVSSHSLNASFCRSEIKLAPRVGSVVLGTRFASSDAARMYTPNCRA